MNQKISFQLSADDQAVMAAVDTFEQADDISRSDLRSFLKDVPTQIRRAALNELVRVDFERRWKRGQRRPVKDYVREYPELAESQDSLVELLQGEYDFLASAGQQPDINEFREVCPSFTPRPSSETSRAGLMTETYGDVAPAREMPMPTQIGKYKIIKKLGKGGFGTVYQGREEQLKMDVAIKVWHGSRGRSGLSDELLSEARNVAGLDHPHIVKVLEADKTAEGVGYVVYQYINGETLDARIKRGGYDHAQAAEWIAKVAEALNYCHKRDVVHRDIKPANIMIDAEGEPKVVDFGLASSDSQFYIDDRNRVLGTAAYMSPEQAHGNANWASSHSDLYSLGVVTYELLCRRRPFTAKELNDLLEQVKYRTPAPPRSIDNKLPKPLEDVCMKALTKEPAQRYSTGHDMASAIRSAVRPAGSLAATVVRYAAALVAVAAVAWVVMYSGGKAGLTPAPQVPLSLSSFYLLLPDGKRLDDEDLPLGPTDLETNLTFNQPAYSYLLVYNQNEKGKLLWPSGAALKEPSKSDRVVFPANPAAEPGVSIPNADGASLVVVLYSPEPVSEAALQSALDMTLDLGVSPEDAAGVRSVRMLADPLPPADFNRNPPIRGGGPTPTRRIVVNEDFKTKLKSVGGSYLGYIVAHKQASGQ